MATYAVGDIQGCLAPLLKLLDHIKFDDKCDSLWLAGDLVNRGPDSLETLRFVKSLGDSAKVVLGNHDLHLMASALGYKRLGPKDTLKPILKAKDSDELLHWLHQQPLVHYDPKLDYCMVHAGIPPIWSIKKALKRSKEIEQVLQSEQCVRFFANMYGNLPNKWSSDLQGPERWRVITNYFTRMRFCKADGELELTTKTGPETAPEGYAPWFSHSNHKCKGENIIFGHWAALMGKTGRDNFVGLDTGCVWGGTLTMMRLDDKQKFSVGYR